MHLIHLVLIVYLISISGRVCSEEEIDKHYTEASPQVVLLNDTLNWYHWGCTGNSNILHEQIQDLGFDLKPVPISQIQNCEPVPKTIEDFLSPAFFHQFRTANKSLIDTLNATDIVVVNGEGTLHGANKGPRILLYLSYVAKAFLKKHVEIINHSVYPNNTTKVYGSDTEKLYQLVYQNVDFISVREEYSSHILEQLGLKVTKSFDCLSEYIQRHYHKKVSQNEKLLLVSGGSMAHIPEGRKAVAEYIQIMMDRGFQIKVLIGAKEHPAKDALEFVEALRKQIPSGWDLVDAQSIDEWLDTISSASLLLSGRFHHSLAAATLGTPFVAINGNTPKVQAISEMLKLPPPLSYSDKQLTDKLLERTAYMLAHDPALVTQRIHELSTLAERNFDGLRSLRRQRLRYPGKLG